MGKGLIINEDVWELIDDLDGKELKNLVTCLAAFHREQELPERMKAVKGVFNRIVLDNGRFDEDKRTSLSEIRRQAVNKRWEKARQANDTNGIQTDTKVHTTDTNIQNAQEENRKEEKRIEENRYRFVPPTVEEIKAYAEEKGYKNFDAERFWNFYESKGWMVGSNKMTNYKSAISGWALRDKTKLAESAKPQTDYKAQLSKLDYGALLRK